MKYQNFQTCNNCGKENPLYANKCENCHHYVRANIVNIDLWSTIWKLFESPVEALKNIIYAQHKNFVIFLTIFVSIKFLLISSFLQSLTDDSVITSKSFIYNTLLHSAIYIAFFLVFSFILNLMLKKFGKSRFKDSYSVTIFSFIPLILSLFFLTPIEYGIFGKHWFIFNPSPFLIKEIPAYIVTFLELILIIWSLIIFWKGLRLQSGSVLFSLIMLFAFLIPLYFIMTFISYILI
ncbi:MAG: zinc ribbon domain-containing protein [Ignavibacteriae bacterium]|nr:zinc ribbon domain-containing protein [Ignavibacteriota bacterium]